MASLRGMVGRLRGERVDEIAVEVAEIRQFLLEMNHTMVSEAQNQSQAMTTQHHEMTVINHTLATMNNNVAELIKGIEAQRTVLLELNHDVRSGADGTLPLFLGYAERLRLDTDTAIGAAQVIERQLAILEALVAPAKESEPT